MHTAFGKSAGMPNRTPRKSGVINPINRPYGHPQIYPHNSTGICIGQSIFPIAGICIVIKGRISPIARNIAARILFLKAIFSLISNFSFLPFIYHYNIIYFLFVFLFVQRLRTIYSILRNLCYTVHKQNKSNIIQKEACIL